MKTQRQRFEEYAAGELEDCLQIDPAWLGDRFYIEKEDRYALNDIQLDYVTFKKIDSFLNRWQPIETAPKDGKAVLLYRPLTYKVGDPSIALGATTESWTRALPETVPKGCDGRNYTTRACYASHWMPAPEKPEVAV